LWAKVFDSNNPGVPRVERKKVRKFYRNIFLFGRNFLYLYYNQLIITTMNEEIKDSLRRISEELSIVSLITGNIQSGFLAQNISLLLDVSENDLHSQILCEKMKEFIEKVNFIEGNISMPVFLTMECKSTSN
jgi:hypothetical protein